MLFTRRVQTVGPIKEFVNADNFSHIRKEIKKINKKTAAHGIKASLTTLATGATAISITNILYTNHAYAQGPVEYVKGKASERIVEAFMPLVDMIQALSYPIALVMLTAGALMFMINQKDRGISMIQNASIGYIFVQMMPIFMQLIVEVGISVAVP
ncbi:hypothetical protein [Bacillus badius]|uniref:Uncharacterized protein n=1 Tax=Bacillus badius TaxID=1455 RepID=A0ABR5APG4_BACBA|nr:hypothetical protein [Bacillus badius]KIL74241.1 hypothetical protein SD77_2896 [Bacillus badius]KZR57458.1 hypothetical protein A3781_20075 [Bacillus badius]MED4717293.1 hypothetical protein [Bacillus badius]